jgi:hypothetical protein
VVVHLGAVVFELHGDGQRRRETAGGRDFCVYIYAAIAYRLAISYLQAAISRRRFPFFIFILLGFNTVRRLSYRQ